MDVKHRRRGNPQSGTATLGRARKCSTNVLDFRKSQAKHFDYFSGAAWIKGPKSFYFESTEKSIADYAVKVGWFILHLSSCPGF